MTALPDFSQDFNLEEELQTAEDILKESNEEDPFLIDLEADVANLTATDEKTPAGASHFDTTTDLASLLQADDTIVSELTHHHAKPNHC